MKKEFCSLILIVMFIFLLSLFSNASVPRIGSVNVNQSEVQKIYIAPGRSSIIVFPCNIKSFSTGPTNDISANLNERDSRLLEVWISKSQSEASGLKVICNENYFAFDIISSKNTHQDYLFVKKTFRSIEFENETEKKIVLSSKMFQSTQENKGIPKIKGVILSSKKGVL